MNIPVTRIVEEITELNIPVTQIVEEITELNIPVPQIVEEIAEVSNPRLSGGVSRMSTLMESKCFLDELV